MIKTLGIFLVTCVTVFCLAAPSQADLIVNGGFESGDFSPGWTTFGNVIPEVDAVFDSGSDGLTSDGRYFATFSNWQSDGSAGISQAVSTTPGQTYNLSFWFATNASGLVDNSNEFKVAWDNDVQMDIAYFDKMPWTNFTFPVTGTGSDTVSFSGYQTHGYNGLDDVSLTPTPEPATLSLLALGGLAVLRRRRGR